MRGTLLLAILTIRGSYSRNFEVGLEDSGGVPDTLQWWIAESGCYRIRTYAIDHDIHAFDIGGSLDGMLELARANNRKNYGDVIQGQYKIEILDCANRSLTDAAFAEAGLLPRIEIDPAGRFVFWKPDDVTYKTKSTPK